MIDNPHTSMSPEFWGALIGAVIGALGAITGVIIQRSFERRDRSEEQKAQRQEIARGLILEIDGFYRNYLIEIRASLNSYQPGQEQQMELLAPPANSPFPIYHANAFRLGEFERAEVEAIISFYSLAESLMNVLNEAVRVKTALYIAASKVQAGAAAQSVLRNLKSKIDQVISLGAIAARTLATRARISFDEPSVAIARERR